MLFIAVAATLERRFLKVATVLCSTTNLFFFFCSDNLTLFTILFFKIRHQHVLQT